VSIGTTARRPGHPRGRTAPPPRGRSRHPVFTADQSIDDAAPAGCRVPLAKASC